MKNQFKYIKQLITGAIITSTISFSGVELAQAQRTLYSCPEANVVRVRIPKTINRSVSSTNGLQVVSFRKPRFTGLESIDIFVDGVSLGTFRLPLVLDAGRLAVQYRLRTNPFSGKVEQEQILFVCPPWVAI
ncbi:hypothetical protein [Mastigocoleus testarum]|uniref:Uncharacterized protein n=1 Tax=Mastigocoleus testarum BC008 TaxID=371196 RepID=A0A0V7ZGX4_9CYAN|nr:hypothetical protein [Mastigocoleus testarum]KST63845.1 hypothetical protein BC008_15430 [Mastigocoleus testarum BC008]